MSAPIAMLRHGGVAAVKLKQPMLRKAVIESSFRRGTSPFPLVMTSEPRCGPKPVTTTLSTADRRCYSGTAVCQSNSAASSPSISSSSTAPPTASSENSALGSSSSSERTPRVTLFTGGPECSLCEIMKEDLAIVQMTHPFELRLWNIYEPPTSEGAGEAVVEREKKRAQRYREAYWSEIPVLHMNGKYIGRHRLNATTFKKQLEAYRAGDELFHIAHLTPSRETIRRRGGDPLKFQVEREEHLKRVEANQAKRLAHLDGQEAVETEVDELGEPWAGEEDAEGVKKASSTVRPKPKLSRRARKRPTESWTPPTNVDGTPIRRSKEESRR